MLSYIIKHVLVTTKPIPEHAQELLMQYNTDIVKIKQSQGVPLFLYYIPILLVWNTVSH